VRPQVSSRDFRMGSFETTNNQTDFAIEGDGFFVVQLNEDNVAYTRDGAFKISIIPGEGSMLTSSDGIPILSVDGERIIIPEEVSIRRLSVDSLGNMIYYDANNEAQELDIQIALVQFTNPQGLEAVGSNLYITTPASGEALSEAEGETNTISTLRQGLLELSNVNVAEEMVSLIVAQRGYELNSKAIQTSDEMLQQANNLKR